MQRGDVWWAELEGDAGFRPVAIVSRSDAIPNRNNLTIAEITRTIRRRPSEVPLTRDEGMPTDCVVNTDNLHTIPKDRLRVHILSMGEEKQFALSAALRYSLELDW